MPLSPSFLADCRRLLGPDHVLTTPAALSAYDSDGLTQHRFTPDAVVLPGSTDELKAVLRLMQGQDAPYTLRGAGTGLSGGAVAVEGGLVIHLSRLKRILSIDPLNLVAEVEPGVVHQALNKALEPHGLFYPPDPSSGFASTLGGNVAENAGGIRCFKYGVTAHYVLGLEVMTPASDVVTLGGPAGGLGAAGGADGPVLRLRRPAGDDLEDLGPRAPHPRGHPHLPGHLCRARRGQRRHRGPDPSPPDPGGGGADG